MAGEVTVGLASPWPCVTNFRWFVHLRPHGPRKRDEHPAYTHVSQAMPHSFPSQNLYNVY